MQFRAILDRVIVQPDSKVKESVSDGGIVVIDSKPKEKANRGKVIAVGPDFDAEREGYGVGDRIIFGQYSGSEVKVDGEKIQVMKPEDVIAVETS